MKKIEAIINPIRLEEVTYELSERGINGMTVTDVKGYGKQKGHMEENANVARFVVNFIPKVKIEIIVCDANVKSVIDAIIKGAKTGQVGDGKIFVSPIEEAIRIRTGESKEEAL